MILDGEKDKAVRIFFQNGFIHVVRLSGADRRRLPIFGQFEGLLLDFAVVDERCRSVGEIFLADILED